MANETTITAEAGKLDYFIVREFEAPRELVFKAFTDPELVTKWLGPHGLKMTIEKFESRDGGTYRYVHEDQNGNRFIFRGVNHEVLSPERIIGTFEFEGLPERVMSLCRRRNLKPCLAGERESLLNPSFNPSLTATVC